jgi:hypothetical protein
MIALAVLDALAVGTRPDNNSRHENSALRYICHRNVSMLVNNSG